MGDLSARIAGRIRREGPLGIDAFMAIALHDAENGYYARHDPLGAAGDFTTAPEISQIFGELIGLWCAQVWRQMGEPDRVILVELGPGSGALLSDLLRAAATLPQFRRALDLYLVEASSVLREKQQSRLAGLGARFVASIDALPEGPLLLVANEFLDALPIRQLVRGRAEWAERVVTLDPALGLVFAQGPETCALSLLVPEALRALPADTLVEIRPAALALAASLGERLARQPGAALFVDYGYFPSSPGPTLAALRRHKAVSLLDDPGSADLSAHVDFGSVASAARAAGAIVRGPVTQGQFLTALGAEERLRSLSVGATEAQRTALRSGLERLIDPAQMGNLFKALALTSPGMPAPAGFE